MTYRQWDPDFQYTHIEESEIDVNAWGDIDPRRNEESDVYYCKFCEKKQSDDPKENECSCFPDLYGNQRSAPALQVFSTVNGRNNGVIACCVRSLFSLLPTGHQLTPRSGFRPRHRHWRIHRRHNPRALQY